MRVRFKSRKPGPSKFNSGWSGAHEVLGTQGVLVTIKEKSTGRVYKMHHDRLSNPIFNRNFKPKFAEGSNPPPEGSDSNPQENPKEPEEDSEPAVDPQLALRRSRYGRVVKPNRDPAFDYSSFLLSSRDSNFEPPVSDFCFMFSSARTGLANPDSQPPATVQGSALTRLRRELVRSGERVFYVDTPTGPEWMVMLRASGTIMVFNAELGTFYNEPSETLLEDLCDYSPWPRKRCYRALAAEEVELPASLEDFPGWVSGSKAHLQPRYGYTDDWLNYVSRRAAIDGRELEPMTIEEVLKKAIKSGTSAPEGSTFAAGGSSASTEFDTSRVPSTQIPVLISTPTVTAPVVSKLSSPSVSAEPQASFPVTTAESLVVVSSSTRPVATPIQGAETSGTRTIPTVQAPHAEPQVASSQAEIGAQDGEVPEPSAGAASDSPLAGGILDASLRAALMGFAHQEENRLVVDADRLLEHCRQLGYGLIGTAAAPAPEPLPMDEGGFGDQWGDDATLSGEAAGAPMEEEAGAQSDGGDEFCQIVRHCEGTRRSQEVRWRYQESGIRSSYGSRPTAALGIRSSSGAASARVRRTNAGAG